MKILLTLLKRYWMVAPLLILVAVVIGGLTYLSGMLGLNSGHTVEGLPTKEVTIVPPQVGTPVALYAQVDPAVVQFLESAPEDYETGSISSFGRIIQPVGAYLPRSGNTQFELIEPTLEPTPLLYLTATPLPLPFVEQTPTPTPTGSFFTESGTPRTIPYTPGDDECAPAGNPASGVLTQRFHRYHGGIDIGVPLGTPVRATHSGQITYAGWSNVGYGYLVTLKNGAFTTYYAHNTSFNVSQGQYVGKGSIIAWSGSTGNSTGPHIHYETRINNVPVDPLTFESRGYPSC